MNFTASNYNQTIPSRSSFVPSDNQLRYTDAAKPVSYTHLTLPTILRV